jgi:hypothetical protein
LKVAILTAPTRSNGVAAIVFRSIKGRSYIAQYRNRLESGFWQTLTNLPPVATDGWLAVEDPAAGGQPQRFYRVFIPPQP